VQLSVRGGLDYVFPDRIMYTRLFRNLIELLSRIPKPRIIVEPMADESHPVVHHTPLTNTVRRTPHGSSVTRPWVIGS